MTFYVEDTSSILNDLSQLDPDLSPKAPKLKLAVPNNVREEVQEKPEPSFGQLFGAWQQEMTGAVSIGAALSRPDEIVVDYNPYDEEDEDLSNYNDQLDAFIQSKSPADTMWIKKRIDSRKERQQLIADGGYTNIPAFLSAMIADPLNLIPVVGWGSKAIKGYSAAKAATIFGGQVAGIEAGNELLLRIADPSRTNEESFYNIAGAALVGGALGAAGKYVTRQSIDQIGKEVGQHLKSETPQDAVRNSTGQSIGAAHTGTTMEQERLVREGIIGPLSTGPVANLATSPSIVSRRIGQQIAEDSFVRVKNRQGLENPISVETVIKNRDNELSAVYDTTQNGWIKYSKRVAKKDRTLKTVDDFNEAVGVALHRGDRSTQRIQEVDAAATDIRKYYANVGDDLVEVGYFSDNFSVKGAISYFPRAYNRGKIVDNHNEFLNELAEEIRSNNPDIEFDPDELRSAVENIRENIILGGEDKAINSIFSKANPIRTRNLNIEFSDPFITKWLDTNVTRVVADYHHSIIPRIEMKRMFGSTDLADIKTDIRTNYTELKRGAKTAKEIKKLDKRYRADIDAVDDIKDRLLGTVDRGYTRGGKAATVISNVKELNRMGDLGGVLITSLPDLARLITVDGLLSVGRKLYQMVDSSDIAKMSRAEKQAVTSVLEIVENTRLKSLADITDDVVPQDKFTKAVQYLGQKFSFASGLSHWNAGLKQMAGHLTEDKIIIIGQKLLANTRVKKSKLTDLATLGISPNLAIDIAKQFNKYGSTYKGLRLSNYQDWDDLYAVTALQAALRKNVDQVINTPGAGTLPSFFDNGIASMIFQYKSFMFAAWNQTLLAGLQRSDANFYISVVGMVAMGALGNEIKNQMYGREKSQNVGDFVWNAVDQSGIAALPFDIHNMIEKGTGGDAAIPRLWGGGPTRRYVNRNLLGSLSGPTGGLIQDTGLIVNSLNEDWDTADVHRIRRLIPFQNLFYLRRVFNDVQNGLTENLGMEGREQPGWFTGLDDKQ